MTLDSIVVDELVIGADKSYLRFDFGEWYKYELGNITFVLDSDWLEKIYKDKKQ